MLCFLRFVVRLFACIMGGIRLTPSAQTHHCTVPARKPDCCLLLLKSSSSGRPGKHLVFTLSLSWEYFVKFQENEIVISYWLFYGLLTLLTSAIDTGSSAFGGLLWTSVQNFPDFLLGKAIKICTNLIAVKITVFRSKEVRFKST